MQVDDGSLRTLLDLQEQDSAIKRLHHQRDNLPEAQRLAQLRSQLDELDADIQIATKQNDEVVREQTRLEGEVELQETKIAREEKRLFSGAVSNPKELGALQQEVAMLRNQRSTLEDRLLEVMEQREQAAETLSRLQEERGAIAAEVAELSTAVAELTGGIEAELADRGSRRDEIAASISDQLVELYDQIRMQKQGVGAAALVGGVCQGCHTSLPAKEVERIRHEGGLQRCDNCRRILIVA